MVFLFIPSHLGTILIGLILILAILIVSILILIVLNSSLTHLFWRLKH